MIQNWLCVRLYASACPCCVHPEFVGDQSETSPVCSGAGESGYDSCLSHLLAKLQLFGINGNILLWLSDFLYDRKQRVVIDGAFSDWGNVISGVPQSSILGPLLFVL